MCGNRYVERWEGRGLLVKKIGVFARHSVLLQPDKSGLRRGSYFGEVDGPSSVVSSMPGAFALLSSLIEVAN